MSVNRSFEVLDPLFVRAIRNIPYATEIWVHYLRAYEMIGKEEGEYMELYSRAHTMISQLGDASATQALLLEYCRRTRRVNGVEYGIKAYTEAFSYIPTQFPGSLPKSLQASFVNSFGGDERVGTVYESMTAWMGVDLWKAYAGWMGSRGNVEKTRSVYVRGCKRRVEGIERLAKAWVEWEGDCAGGAFLYQALDVFRSKSAEGSMMEVERVGGGAEKKRKVDANDGVPIKAKKDKAVTQAKVSGAKNGSEKVAKAEAPKASGKRGIDEVDDMAEEVVGHQKKKTKTEYDEYHVLYSPMAGNMVRVTGFGSGCDVEYFEQVFNQVWLVRG
jgi:hypothetical protein